MKDYILAWIERIASRIQNWAWDKRFKYRNHKKKRGRQQMKNKKSWWSLKIHDYPNYDPNDADLEHISEQIRQGNHQGELIQEESEVKNVR